MPDETLFEFEQSMSRADAAAYLREVADRLDANGTLHFTAGGQSTSVSVPDRLQFEVAVERNRDDQDRSEIEVEFELEWSEDGGGPSGPGSLEIG